MPLPRIRHQLRLHLECSQSDVHLDALGDGDTLVLFTVEYQGRGPSVANVADRGAFIVWVGVVIDTISEIGQIRAGDISQRIVADEVRHPCPHDGRFEPIRPRNGQGGQVTTPTPAADPEPVRVGQATLDHGLYPCKHVLKLSPTDITEDSVRESSAASCAPPGVGQRDCVAPSGEYLCPVAPGGATLVCPQRGRSSVYLYHERVTLALTVVTWPNEQPLDLDTGITLPPHHLHLTESCLLKLRPKPCSPSRFLAACVYLGSVDLRWVRPVLAHHRQALSVRVRADGVTDSSPSLAYAQSGALPFPIQPVKRGDHTLVAQEERLAVRKRAEILAGSLIFRCQADCLTALQRTTIDVIAMRDLPSTGSVGQVKAIGRPDEVFCWPTGTEDHPGTPSLARNHSHFRLLKRGIHAGGRSRVEGDHFTAGSPGVAPNLSPLGRNG